MTEKLKLVTDAPSLVGQSRPNTVPELIARCPQSPVCDRNCAAAQHIAMGQQRT